MTILTIFSKIFNTEWRIMIFLFCISCLFGFTKLGSHPIEDWDEARQAVNAQEMILRNDIINYTYDFAPDTWNAKPPLMVWSIALCYKVLGYNAWALRLPAVLASILFFLAGYKTLRLFWTRNPSLFVCLALTGCKAIWWGHVGRTGDFDAFLMLFSTLFIYFSLLYFEKGKKNALYLSAVFLGFAFYSKGTACTFLLPGMALYCLLFGKIFGLFKDYRFYISILIFLCFVGSWIYLIERYGFSYQQGGFSGAKNAWQTMVYYDTFNRFTNHQEVHQEQEGLNFFLSVLDVKFFLLGYSYYLAVLVFIITLVKSKEKLSSLLFAVENRLVVISILLSAPLIILLTVSSGKHAWYLAPVDLFIAVTAGSGLYAIYKARSWFKYIMAAILAIQLCVQFFLILSPKKSINEDFLLENKTLIKENKLILIMPTQSLFAECKWLNPMTRIWDLQKTLPQDTKIFSSVPHPDKHLKFEKMYPETGFLYTYVQIDD